MPFWLKPFCYEANSASHLSFDFEMPWTAEGLSHPRVMCGEGPVRWESRKFLRMLLFQDLLQICGLINGIGHTFRSSSTIILNVG